MSFRHALLLGAVALAVVGCTHRAKTVGTPPPPAPLTVAEPLQMRPADNRAAPSQAMYTPPEPRRPYTLDSGDRLRVVVFGQDNLSRAYAVDGGGYISMPLIGAVLARGLTTFDLERRIAARLAQGYIKDPKVTVEIETYRPFFVLGEVQRPGQYPYVNGMTVQTAVAIAGGFTERARERAVNITRRFNGEARTATVPANFPVEPGDTIYVRERFF